TLLSGARHVQVPVRVEHRHVGGVERIVALPVHVERSGLGVVAGDASASVVARVHPAVGVDGETEQAPAGGTDALGLPVEGDPVELSLLAAGVDDAVQRVPRDALRMIQPVDELIEVLERDQGLLLLLRSFRTVSAALRPLAPLTPPPGWVPAPHRYRLPSGVR